MDAVELARQAASRLHNTAVAAGWSPADPLQFAKAEANRRNIDVYEVSADHPGLKGGQASYDHQAACILVCDQGTAFDRAFLIAHEIGHVELEGALIDNVTTGADPAQASDAATSAVERIVDYSKRERREVRMNLFAREFLMPRSLLRDLYVDHNHTRTQLIAHFKAPADVVTQQLLDALLLPPIPLSEPQQRPAKPPNPSQANAAAHRDAAFQLQAGPGTGKTQTLIDHVDGLLKEGIEPESILVLTFSNKAAGELIERLSAKHPVAAAGIWIGTFHSFGLDVIRRFHDRLGLPLNVRPIDRSEAIEILEDELARLPLRHYRDLRDPTLVLKNILAAISRAKDEVVNAARYRELAEAMIAKAGENEEARLQGEKCLEVAWVYEIYETLLVQRGLVDFGDLVAAPVRLAEQDAEVRASLATRHRHIIVDEYQDVNRASVRLLIQMHQPGNRIWVVGDARQSIYRFRGASAANMTRFTTDFAAAQVSALDVNYRSFEQIVDCYSDFAATMQASQGALPLELTPERGKGSHQPELRTAATPEDEISQVAAAIEEAKASGIAYREQAVLCTGNARLAEFAAGLEARGLPVLYLGSLFERPEIKGLLAILSILQDRFAAALVSIAAVPTFSMTLSDVQTITRYLREHDARPMDWTRLAQAIPGLSDQGRASLEALASAVGDFEQTDQPWKILTTLLLDRLATARDIAKGSTVKDRMQGIAIWQLLNFAQTQPSAKGAPVARFLERIRKLIRISDDRELRQLPDAASSMDGIHLLTIHASKGLEFPVVHLPGLIKARLPRANTPPICLPPDGLIDGAGHLSGRDAAMAGHEQEQECIFFVALSRARDRLIIYTTTHSQGGRKSPISPFLEPISHRLFSKARPAHLPGLPRQSDAIAIAWTTPPHLSDHQLGQYDRCPRRFFYSYVLKIGGRRAESAFTQMHDALQTVLDWISAEHATQNPPPEALAAAIDAAWQKSGPIEHPYAADYRRLTDELVHYLVTARANQTLLPPKPLSIDFGDSRITVIPHHVVTRPDGSVAVRRVKTGKRGSEEFSGLDYTVLLLAARDAYGPSSVVEAVHLTGRTVAVADITDRSLTGRRAKAVQAMQAIRAGTFPADPDERRCPICPHLFHCGALPDGAISAEI